MSATADTFPISPDMHPMNINLAAIEVLDLARMHLNMAKKAMLCGQGEMHDWHECRAHGLVASVRETAPEVTERDAWDDLRDLWVHNPG